MPDEPITPAGPDGANVPHSERDRDGQETVPGADRIIAEIHEAGGGATRSFSAKQVRRARELLTRLYGLRRARRLYPLEHPAIAGSARYLHEIIAQYHAEGTDVPLTFFEDEVLLGDQVLTEDSILFDQLVRDMSSIGAGSITFMRELNVDELVRFSNVIGARPDEVARLEGGIARLVEIARTPHISVGTVSVVRDDVTVEDEDAQTAARTSYTGAVDLLRELERLIRSNQIMSASHVKGTVRSLIDNILHNRFAMLELSGLKSFDEYTFFHSVNVSILALALGSMLSRDYRFLSTLGVGALLHDMGKTSVAIEVLNKTGPLTSEEWGQIRQHPVRGAELIALTSGLDRASLLCVLEHHMRYDLTGYPERTPQRAQHLMSRIVAVADAYDAMTSQRPYSAPRMQDEAMGIIVRNAGTALDPTLVQLFVGLLGYYPPRSLVLLDSGETGVVIAPGTANPDRPTVRIIADAAGRIHDPIDVDLADNAAAAGRGIVRCLDGTSLNIDVADYL
jgi:HD-GYP domain-containing protein (c-di-GMP phosphodiesterase class II)